MTYQPSFFPEASDEGADGEAVLSVSELTAQVKLLLEGTFDSVWVSGEISNFSRPRSGHCYLTLKDDEAQLRAVIWRGTAARLRFDLHDGLEVVCHGHLDVYAPRGSYQLVIEEIEPKGIGALELALRQLHARLAAEGLFDPGRKRPLPRFPRRVAVVTSPTGAAIRDFLQVLRRRWQGLEVWIVPVRVQGDGAAAEIAAAIDRVSGLAEAQAIDCLVVTRGGGSLEDLWAFNEEAVVRAIHRSAIPVVSAIGHEIDVTLSDMVADVRALTPSEAAERIAPAADEVRKTLAHHRRHLEAAVRGRIEAWTHRLDRLAACRALQRPEEWLHELSQRLDELSGRADRAIGHRLRQARSEVTRVAGKLESLSPLAVLSRGYSLTYDARGQLIRNAGEVAPGDRIATRLATGTIDSRVEQVHLKDEDVERAHQEDSENSQSAARQGADTRPAENTPDHAGGSNDGSDGSSS